MILARGVFQAKYGRGGELVALFKEAYQRWPNLMGDRPRLLTDLSGPFFTVVSESEYPSLGDWERQIGGVFNQPEFGEWFERMQPLVESGRREFYTIES